MVLAPEWERAVFSGARLILGLGGEGSGKSYSAAAYAVCRSIHDLLSGGKLYWIVGQDFEDARSDFMPIVDFQEKLGNVHELNTPASREEQCRLVTKTGQTFLTMSARDPTKIARDEPDGIVGAEFTRWITDEVFRRCEGRLLRKYPRAWGIFTGSFESSLGWVPELYTLGQGPNERGIRSFTIPSWANPHRYPGGRDNPAIKLAELGSSPERFMERFGGQPAPPQGIIFHEFKNYLHVDPLLKVDNKYPVYLFIDPGDLVYCVLYTQFVDGECRVIDEVYVSHWTHEQVIDEIKNNEVYPLVRGGVIDIAATQHHMGMPAPFNKWYEDTGLQLVAQKQSVDDTIERVRAVLSVWPVTGRSRLLIHPRCRGLISEMGGGPSPVAEGGPWMRFKMRSGFGPPQAKNDHACKALGYGLAFMQYFMQGDNVEKGVVGASYALRSKSG